MAEIPPANHPFLYTPRWTEIPGLNAASQYLLDERDRELEDYLGTLSAAAPSTLAASSMSRSTNQSGGSLPTTVNMTTSDWLSGCSASTYNGGGCLQVDVAGKYHCTAGGQVYTFSVASSGLAYLSLRRAGSVVREVIEYVPNGGPLATDLTCNLSCDFNAQVGDLIVFEVREAAGGGGGISIGVTASAAHPALLQAHLVG